VIIASKFALVCKVLSLKVLSEIGADSCRAEVRRKMQKMHKRAEGTAVFCM